MRGRVGARGHAACATSLALAILGGCMDAGPSTTGDALDGLLAEGEEIYRSGDFAAAMDVFEGARIEAFASGDSARGAVAVTWLGLASYQLGAYDDAWAHGEYALALKERLALADELPRSLNALGLLAWTEGRLQDALDLHQRSLAAATAVDDSAGIARALNNLGLVETDLGSLTVAGARYEEARAIFAGLGLTQFEGRVLTNIGALHIERGDAIAAEEALLNAFDRYREDEDPLGEVNALGQLGVVYAAQGDPQRGLELLDSARVMARELGLQVEEASNLEQLANIHLSLGSNRLAIDLFERADSINRGLELDYEHGANLRARARIHHELGNEVLAVGMVEEALALHEGIGAMGEVQADLLVLARIRGGQGRNTEVRALLDRADSLASALGSVRARLDVALERAELVEERPDLVLDALDAVATDVDGAPADHQWWWWALRARALRDLGDDGAVEAARQSVAIVDRIRTSLGSRFLRGSLAAARAETYHVLVDVLLERGRTAEAFEVSDASRGRELSRHLAVTEARTGASGHPGLAAEEDLLVTLAYLDRSLDDWLSGTPPEARDAAFQAQVSAITEERERARLEYARLLAEGDGSGASDLAILGADHAGADDVRRSLRPGEALLEYLVMEDRTVVFGLRPERIEVWSLAVAAEELGSRLRVAHALARDPAANPASVDAVLGGLYDLLIRPVAEEGALDGVTRLFLVPDGTLGTLPFAALRDRQAGRFLVERYDLADAPSAAAWLSLRAASDVGAVPASGAGFAPFPDELPASAGEVRRFATHHPGQTLVGADATEARFRAALGSGVVVHAAAHGVLNWRNPLFSRIEFRPGGAGPADDGTLRVHELLEMRARAPLVFLSACETGAGPVWNEAVTGGSAYAALSQAMLFAGAHSVVGTLWPVRDDAASELASRFYEGLPMATAAASLAEAQRGMLTNPRTAAPFFWAGYRLTGAG